MAENKPEDKHIRLHITFYRRPMAILGEDRACGLRLEKTIVEDDGSCLGTGETETLPTGLVVPCIGYRSAPIDDVPYDDHRGRFINEEGLISERLYCVGWARRGPTGTIGTNKPDGVAIAKKILDEVQGATVIFILSPLRIGKRSMRRKQPPLMATRRVLNLHLSMIWSKLRRLTEVSYTHGAYIETCRQVYRNNQDEMSSLG